MGKLRNSALRDQHHIAILLVSSHFHAKSSCVGSIINKIARDKEGGRCENAFSMTRPEKGKIECDAGLKCTESGN